MTNILGMDKLIGLEEIMPVFSPEYPSKYLLLREQLSQMIKSQKFNEQANVKAEALIEYDEANYNAWYVKKMCFDAGVVSLDHERKFLRKIFSTRLKGFQIWQHLRFLIERSKNYEEELQCIQIMMETDDRNYHAWSLRTWIVDQSGSYEAEIEFSSKIIKRNGYNNSAWTYRRYLMNCLWRKQPERQSQLIDFEIAYAMERIRKEKDNMAAWNYLRSFFSSIKLKVPSQNTALPAPMKSYGQQPEVANLCYSLLKDIEIELKQENMKEQARWRLLSGEKEVLVTLLHIQAEKKETTHFARNTCEVLISRDPLRANYWKWLLLQLNC